MSCHYTVFVNIALTFHIVLLTIMLFDTLLKIVAKFP